MTLYATVLSTKNISKRKQEVEKALQLGVTEGIPSPMQKEKGGEGEVIQTQLCASTEEEPLGQASEKQRQWSSGLWSDQGKAQLQAQKRTSASYVRRLILSGIICAILE